MFGFVILLYILSGVHNWVVGRHLCRYTRNNQLWEQIRSTESFSYLETSIKITQGDTDIIVNTDRYTIPSPYKIIRPKLPDIFRKLGISEDLLEWVDQTIISEQDDVILGLDKSIVKVYIDTGLGQLTCRQEDLNSGLKQIKKYKQISNIHVENELKKHRIYGSDIALQQRENWNFILRKEDTAIDPVAVLTDETDFSGYHIHLTKPVKVRDLLSRQRTADMTADMTTDMTTDLTPYLNDDVYWFAVGPIGTTLYTRPWLPHLSIWDMCHRMWIILTECWKGLVYLILRF